MKKKVRKFASGGDILTGLGAGMLGLALYKKFKGEGKDEKEPEAVGGASRRARTIEEQIGRKADESKEPSAAEKRAMAASKGRPELIPEGADEAVMRSDNYATPKPKPAAKKAKPAAQPTTEVKKESTTTPATYYTSPAKKPTVSKSGVKGTQSVGETLGMVKPGEAKGTQTLGERIKGTIDSADKSVMRTPQQRMADAAREVEARRKREAEGMKHGGKVKRYAEGGTATSKPEPKKNTMPEWAKNERENRRRDELNKRESEGAAKEVKRNMSTFGFKSGGSASSRADGCAIRGKTRGKVY